MMKTDNSEFLSQEQLLEVLHVIETVGIMILFDFSKRGLDTRNKVIRNFIARANLTLKSISELWKIGAYQDCWVLFRCILDRLFHLYDLVQKNSFEDFEAWSLIEQYEQAYSAQSDLHFRHSLTDEFLEHQNNLKSRYHKLKQTSISYKRPRPKEIARNMDLMFLYKFGYDFASTQIHPMANDGEEAFLRQIGDHKHSRHMDHRSVLRNSCLVHVLLIQDGLIASERRWIGIIARLLREILSFLESGNENYKLTFVKLGKLGPGLQLSSEKPK